MVTSTESIELSRDFYGNPQNYGPFSLTRDARRIIGCIDPRDPADELFGYYKIMVQNAGAGAGEAMDMAIAETAHNNRLVTVEEGLTHDQAIRLTSVLDAHPACKLIGSMAVVFGEIANPSTMTIESVGYWARKLDVDDVITSNIDAVASAAQRQQEYVGLRDNMEHLVAYVGELYPEHDNVHPMKGANVARVYTVNLHPNIGIDRNKKDPAVAEAVQGYHDNLAASVVELGNARGLETTVRGLRLTALLLRAAAVRTVLTRDIREDMTFFEVQPAYEGVRIIEQCL